MAEIKSYTDLRQSKKLEGILPIKSADMHSEAIEIDGDMVFVAVCGLGDKNKPNYGSPIWSLAALLNVMPSASLDSSDDHHYRLYCMERFTEWYDNAIDACVDMIEKLYEQNSL